MPECTLCPRKCRVNRTTSAGRCGVYGHSIRVGRASLHMWEEPCISGENGSGTIFFAGCNLDCVYCQNKALSQNLNGNDISEKQLADLMLKLQLSGAHNINLVTPTHYLPQIRSAILQAKNGGLYIPIVYNTSGYESVEAIQSLSGLVDVFLTDYKYADDVLGTRYSGVTDYASVAFFAIAAMVSLVGPPVFDENEMLQKGVIVRHLILPGQMQNSKDALSKIFNCFGDDVILSIMNQYTPVGDNLPDELSRTVSEQEYNDIIDFALHIGITNAYIQEEGTQRESFIPSFNGEGVLDDTDFNG